MRCSLCVRKWIVVRESRTGPVLYEYKYEYEHEYEHEHEHESNDNAIERLMRKQA